MGKINHSAGTSRFKNRRPGISNALRASNRCSKQQNKPIPATVKGTEIASLIPTADAVTKIESLALPIWMSNRGLATRDSYF